MTLDADRRFMRLAISLGARGLGRVWPNPAVGCVIVRDGRILGRGWTQPGGRPHAEVMALAQAAGLDAHVAQNCTGGHLPAHGASGATAYVSLEPCAHHGRTPPCSAALIRAGVRRVVTALTDPDPRVAGRGHAQLRAAGIDVTEGVEADAARAVNAGFLLRITHARPMVTLKLALTLDGRIATASGESRWITGSTARRMVHSLRADHDAVLVGGGTARADDPDLRVRGLGIAQAPVRIVASALLNVPVTGRLADSVMQAPVWLVHGPQADGAVRGHWAGLGARLLECPVTGQGLDGPAMMHALAEQGLTRVLCEGGGQLAASLLRAGLVDRLVVFSAGKVIGADGRAGLGALGVQVLAHAPQFRLADVQRMGDDIVHHWSRDSSGVSGI